MLKDFLSHLSNAMKAGTAFTRPDGGTDVLLADGGVHRIEPIDKTLSHVKQAVTLGDADSFTDYFIRFKNPESVILADITVHPPKFAGVIDYHEAPGEAGAAAVPRHGGHKLFYGPTYSEQYVRWRNIDQKLMSQVDFVDFLEENYLDVVAPDSARLLEQVMHLEAKTDVTFKSVVRLSDGSSQLTYNEEIKTGGTVGSVDGRMAFPDKLKIAVPMFVGDHEPVELECFLRFRVDKGALSFAIKIKRRDLVERERAEGMIKDIRQVTLAPVFMGRLGGQ